MVAADTSLLTEERLASLARACAIPLAAYRRAHVESCVERALVRTGTADVDALVARLRTDAAALAAFRRSVLVGVTRMFRDQEEFDLLEHTLLPDLLARRSSIGVWSAGCANGDELRSVAALLERHDALQDAYVLGSDVLDESLASAAARLADEPSSAIRAAVRFEHRDLVLDPAPARTFDLVLCRNVAIYLAAPAQRELHRKLVSVLRPGGLLMLGRSERLLEPDVLGLESVSRHVFRRAA
jgi:chemotaxis protein methyltransferase CheR